jgi:hypothetical protein
LLSVPEAALKGDEPQVRGNVSKPLGDERDTGRR